MPILSFSETSLTTLNNGLLAYYSADNTVNDSLNTYNGSPNGGLTYATGKNNNGWQFNGSNAYVGITTTAFNLQSFTWNIWVKFTSFGANHCIFSNFNGNEGYYLYQNGQNLQFTIWNNGTPTGNATTGSLLTVGWRMLTIRRTSGTKSEYMLDGVLIGTSNTTTNPTYNSTTYPAIGVRKYNNTTFDIWQSEIQDECAIWNRVLTDDEVTELYNSGSGKFYPFT